MKECPCDDWRDNIGIINAPFVLKLTCVGEYRGKEFDYCPWCGNKLEEKQWGDQQFPQCSCGTKEFHESTIGCLTHGVNEFGILKERL